MKVKKCLLVAVISLLTTFFCIVPFSSVKALTQTNGSTDNYGTFYADTLYSENSSSDLPDTISVGIPPFTITYSRTEGSMFKFEYTFNDTYTGYITLSITTDRAYVLNDCEFSVQGAWFGTLPSKTASTTTKTFQIAFKECTGFTFILHCPDPSLATKVFNSNTTYTKSMHLTAVDTNNEILDAIRDSIGTYFDYKLSDMAGLLSDILTTSENLVNVSYFPSYSLPLYLWGLAYSPYSINSDNNLPMFYMNKNNNDSAFTSKYRLTYKGYGSTTEIYFISSYWLDSSRVNVYTQNNISFSKSCSVQQTYNANGTFYYLCKIILSDIGQNEPGGYFEIEFTNNAYIYPLFIGYNGNLPDNLALFMGVDYNNTYTDLLRDIVYYLSVDIDLNDTNENLYNNGLDDIGNFLNTVRNILPTTTPLNNDINGLPNFNTQFTGVSNFVQSVYVDLTTTVPEFKWLIIVGLLAIVMRIIAV